jgi:hypothetical protein
MRLLVPNNNQRLPNPRNSMSSHATTADASAPLDLSRFRKLPYVLGGIGLIIAVIAAFLNPVQFGYAYLTAYLFFLSLCVGGLFLVLIHHLFDAAWSAPIRRLAEHLAVLLFPTMAVLFLPIAILARKIYPWMTIDPHHDHALHAKHALLNVPAWYVISAIIFLIWWFLSRRLRYWSLRQDETGAAQCTHNMRLHACWGIFAFAITVTMAIMLWSKSLQHQWFSTMYGVYYFAASVWTTLATVYFLSVTLKHAGPLRAVITKRQVHDIGVLWFAFTVFYAYIHFSQYFIIWNANIPEETFWYVHRESGSWWGFGMLLIFGHFFVPFLLLLRIDAKMYVPLTFSLAIWAWLMHFVDMTYNIMPVYLPNGFEQKPIALGVLIACMLLIGGVLAIVWIINFLAHPAFPQKDPRMAEGLGLLHPQVSPIAVAKYEGKQ